MGLYNTVELYNEFLNHMESALFYDNLIDISTSGTPANSPKEPPPHCINNTCPSPTGSVGSVNLNLDFDINQFYNHPTVHPLQIRPPDCKPLSCIPLHYSSLNYNPPLNHISCIGLHPQLPPQVPELDLKPEEDEADDDDDLCQGLFPPMDVNDTLQFMTFDMLPLNPSYVYDA